MTSRLIVPDAMTRPSAWPPATLAIKTKYELDAFQQHAVLGIHAGDHVFVTAKTGSGKTFVGEYLIAYYLAQGKRVFYTTPIKSLSNQKYHDLKKLFPTASVGILTGDIKMCPDADIVVMTAEILRNLLYKRGTVTEGVGLTAAVSLDRVAGIVIDEAHYIQDPDRGHVWEETLILSKGLPIQLVLLSATMPSANSLGSWLADLHERNVWMLATTFRVVPLVHGILQEGADGPTVKPLLDSKGYWTENYLGWLKSRKVIADAALAHKKTVDNRRADGYAAPPPTKVRVESPIARLLRTVAWLDETKQMPALFFAFSRKGCERYAGLITGSLLDSSDAAAATHIIDFHLSRYKKVLETSPQYHKVRDLLIRGIGFHHSGLQPLLKEIVEILFTRGYVRVLFATETFSVGLNMPTKTVVFLELEKFSDEGQRLLRPDEYIQMAGRAGRRGLDTQGLVLYQPLDDPIEVGALRSLLTGPLTPLSSRMRFHYDFILRHRLMETDSQISEVDSLKDPPLATQSYWAQQQRGIRSGLNIELASLAQNLEAAEASLTSEQKEAIQTKFDLEMEIATNVNAKRKKAEAALRKWEAEVDESLTRPTLISKYKGLMEARKAHTTLLDSIKSWDSRPLLSLGSLESCLESWGFLDSDLGTWATEFNEGHVILGPLLADSEKLTSLTAQEVVCVLAAFLQEKGVDASIYDAGLSASAIDALTWLGDTATSCNITEDRAGVHSPHGFWRLSALWVCIMSRWFAGSTLSEIARDYDMFEGNIQRAILRIVNIVDEWKAVAGLRRDLAMLEKLNGLSIVRDELIVDSLYLRLN